MVLLILESLGSTELLFILIMALVFFGPRKLPQLSRSLGKNLAEFRKASEDFKRTWEKEVNLEEYNLAGDLNQEYKSLANPPNTGDNSILNNEGPASSLQPPTIEAVAPDRVIARDTTGADAHSSLDETGSTTAQSEGAMDGTKSPPKHDWL